MTMSEHITPYDDVDAKQAQLDRIEMKLDKLLSVVEAVGAGVEQAKNNPMIAQLLRSNGIDL